MYRRICMGHRAGWRSTAGVMLLVLALLSLMPTLGESEDDAKSKPKKPRFEVSSFVLQDNRTGLMWTVNADLAERTFCWEDAQDYLLGMNRGRYAGYSGWRMPSLEELETLVEQVKLMGFDGITPEKSVSAGLRNIGIRNVQSDGYWTSTTNIYYSAEAWCVSMMSGSAVPRDKALYFSLWPVRSTR